MRNTIFGAALLAAITATTGAFAEEAAASGSANVGVSLPGAAPATATAGGSDHDQMVGRLAVGYFGITQSGAGANLGAGPAGPAADTSPYAFTGAAPVVGVRYWLNSGMGLDLGLGLAIIGGGISTEGPPPPNVDESRDSFFGLTLHAGVPFALANTGHFSWQLVPEANIGFASLGQDPNGSDTEGDVSNSGFHLDIGARAGAEIHFGFMGIPQLSLQGSVGIGFAIDKGTTTDSTPPAPGPDVTSHSSRTAFQTTVGQNPWAIFTNSIAAFYYF